MIIQIILPNLAYNRLSVNCSTNVCQCEHRISWRRNNVDKMSTKIKKSVSQHFFQFIYCCCYLHDCLRLKNYTQPISSAPPLLRSNLTILYYFNSPHISFQFFFLLATLTTYTPTKYFLSFLVSFCWEWEWTLEDDMMIIVRWEESRRVAAEKDCLSSLVVCLLTNLLSNMLHDGCGDGEGNVYRATTIQQTRHDTIIHFTPTPYV